MAELARRASAIEPSAQAVRFPVADSGSWPWGAVSAHSDDRSEHLNASLYQNQGERIQRI